MPEARASKTIGGTGVRHVDIAVVGAGFAGLYLLHRLRQAGFTAQGLETADEPIDARRVLMAEWEAFCGH